MALSIYDSSQNAYGVNPMRTFHDGTRGGSYDQLIYIRNNDVSKYYTNITLHIELSAYDDAGEFGTTGWGYKFIYGSRRPTEAEWDNVKSGTPVSLPAIGTTDASDTVTYHPVWVRTYCPGYEPAQIRTNARIRLNYYERVLGS